MVNRDGLVSAVGVVAGCDRHSHGCVPVFGVEYVIVSADADSGASVSAEAYPDGIRWLTAEHYEVGRCVALGDCEARLGDGDTGRQTARGARKCRRPWAVALGVLGPHLDVVTGARFKASEGCVGVGDRLWAKCPCALAGLLVLDVVARDVRSSGVAGRCP